MLVTLKKASELQRAALAAAKAIDIKNIISVSNFSTDDIGTIVSNGRAAFDAALGRERRLNAVGFKLRVAIGIANTTAGIGLLLTKVAEIDADIACVTAASASGDGFDGSIDTTDMVAAQRRLMQARTDALDTETRRFGGREDQKINLLSATVKANLADEIATLKRQRSNIKDELTGINFNQKITLTDDIVAVLREEKLID